MSKVVVKLNTSGVRELLKSSELRDGLAETAHKIAVRAGEGHKYDTKYMGTRVIASVYTDSTQAYHDAINNNKLLKAVQG